ncbi:MAG: nucleoside triphosphate pyrophosphohydrolase [Proteobacteria bacterium]|nr:nucleoside triphosphate pyrophosphohydrolase [Pseudomonadota bacterium]
MKEFDKLVALLEKLRAPDGCPWDAEQDHKSLSRCVIEEACELVDAIQTGDIEDLKEELGDLLLQVVFHSIIAKEKNEFTIVDVINCLCDKLIYRHPHVFGTAKVKTSEEVVSNWQQLKRKEPTKKKRKSILDGIPGTLPSLLYARKIQSAAGKVGFDWEDPKGVIDKIKEEAEELCQAMEQRNRDDIEDEIGDLLFSIVNLARYTGVDPEAALRRTNHKFRARFYEIEKEAKKQGISLKKMSLENMDRIWERAKKNPEIKLGKPVSQIFESLAKA